MEISFKALYGKQNVKMVYTEYNYEKYFDPSLYKSSPKKKSTRSKVSLPSSKDGEYVGKSTCRLNPLRALTYRSLKLGLEAVTDSVNDQE